MEGDEPAAAYPPEHAEEHVQEIALAPERFAQMEGAEEFILTVTGNGYGKRSSAYEYRVTGRGGSGITNIITSARNGKVVASFPVMHPPTRSC